MIFFMESMISGWFNLISLILNETAILIIFTVLFLLSLFLILRWEYKKYKYMWQWDGVPEVFFSGLCSFMVTGTIYLLPIVVISFIFVLALYLFFKIFSILVKLSVRD